MAVRVLPTPIVTMLAGRRHRLRHFLWHAIRGAWNSPELTPEVRQFITDKGWAPPDGRAPFDANRRLILDNHSGEDFLYMHRQMIAEVNQLLAGLGEPPLQAWASIPTPGQNNDFPLPPAWTYADPAETEEGNAFMTERLKRVKSDEYYRDTIAVWESFYTNPSNLTRLSLGAFGNMLEMTVHNNLHMRWASEPLGYMPSPNLQNTADIEKKWDDPKYDYLGDTYSSHVNGVFWYLHGWVDRCIDLWARANRVTDIQWKGTWAGKLEDDWQPGQPQVITRAMRLDALKKHAMPADALGISLFKGGGHGGHGGHGDADVRDMEEIVRKLGSCRVIRNFYDVLREVD